MRLLSDITSLQQYGEIVGCRRANTVLQRFELAAQHGQWCAQLVRSVGDPLTSRMLGGVEPFGESVEDARKIAELVAPPCRQTRVESCFAEPARDRGEFGDRPAEVCGEQRGGDDAKCQTGQRDQQQRALLLHQERDRERVIRAFGFGEDEIADRFAVDIDRTTTLSIETKATSSGCATTPAITCWSRSSRPMR